MKNKKGFALANLLVLSGIGLLYLVTVFSFRASDIHVHEILKGIGSVEVLNAKIEENFFYEKEEETFDKFALTKAVEYAQKNAPIVNRGFKCGERCEEYTELIYSHSKNYNIDPILVLSLIMQESQGVSSAGSSSSFGLMQINLNNCGAYGLPEDIGACKNLLKEDVNKNVEIGLKILNEKYQLYNQGKVFQGCSNRNVLYEGWEAALRGYNGWGCNEKMPEQDNYVEEVIRRYGILKGVYQENLLVKGNIFEKKEEIGFSVKYLGEPNKE